MSFKRPKQLSVLISQRIIKRKTFIESLISIIQILEKDLAWIKNLFLHFYLFEVNRTHNSTFFSDCIGMQSANFRPFLSLYWQSEIDYQFNYMTLYYHDNILCSCFLLRNPFFNFVFWYWIAYIMKCHSDVNEHYDIPKMKLVTKASYKRIDAYFKKEK